MTDDTRKTSGTETRRRNKVLQVRLSDSEFAEVEAHAERALLSPASYVRQTVLDSPAPRARRRPSVEAEQVARVLAQLGKMGSNLNQIAHQMNAGQTIAHETLARAMTDVSVMRDACLSALGRKP